MFMPHIPPGGEISREALNEIIDKGNRRLRSVLNATVVDSQVGVGIAPAKGMPPVFAVLTAKGPDPEKANHYEFKEVFQNPDNEWIVKEEGYESRLDTEFGPIVLNPAVEINGAKEVELNTVVQLTLAPQFAPDEHGRMHRHWYFSSALSPIKAFELTQDLIPTGGGEPDTSVEGYFLTDRTREPVTFYPAQLSGVERSGFLSLGIGRRAGQYVAGTKGWAEWVDQARQEYVNGEFIWIGEWQIITLYASLIAEVRIYDDPLEAGETGPAQLWWMDWDDKDQVNGIKDFALANSTYQLKITNTLEATLPVGTKLAVHLNRDDYRWYPMPDAAVEFYAKVQTGFENDTGADPRVVEVKTCDFDGSNVTGLAFNVQTEVWLSKDTALFTDMVIRYRVMSDGTNVTKVIVSPNQWDEPHGTVIWEAIEEANIRPGWTIANGAAVYIANFGGGNVPDLRERFIMGEDSTDAATDGSEVGIGPGAGFRWHGQAENNHWNHEQHIHVNSDDVAVNVDVSTPTQPVPKFGDTGWAVALPGGLNFLAHFGFEDPQGGGPGMAPFNTDNRPKFWKMAARVRNS